MRLIDAEKLKISLLYDDSWDLEYPTYGAFLVDIWEAPTVEAIPKVLYEQVQWERDIALSQLKQLNIELGEKPYHKAIPIEWIKEWNIEHWEDADDSDDMMVDRMMEDWWQKNVDDQVWEDEWERHLFFERWMKGV